MEGRKVQRVGHSSLAVSLPSDWAKKADIKPGDLVFITSQDDGSLKLIPSTLAEKQVKVEEVIVNSKLCEEEGMLERIIVGNYILGRDVIRVVAPLRLNNSHLNEIRGILPKLMGLGIIEETPNQVILQCSIDPTKFPINRAILRLYIISSLMQKEAIKALVDGDLELAREVINRENEADTIYYLILRLLCFMEQEKMTGKKGPSPLMVLDYRVIAQYLERIADWADLIARNLLGIENHINKIDESLINEIEKLNNLASNICYNAITSISKSNIKLANEAVKEYKQIIKPEEERLIEKVLCCEVEAYVACRLRLIIYDIRRIAELGSEIAQIAINRVLEKSSKICEIY
ncbi:MAG: phosphate uptake regulator PhoU [Candidatus Methylarchaceae archaeon HK02M2]|nr:phosphate uptake regulator PhoU [Candidatus Methylarchaceae archaeon HK02M2]